MGYVVSCDRLEIWNLAVREFSSATIFVSLQVTLVIDRKLVWTSVMKIHEFQSARRATCWRQIAMGGSIANQGFRAEIKGPLITNRFNLICFIPTDGGKNCYPGQQYVTVEGKYLVRLFQFLLAPKTARMTATRRRDTLQRRPTWKFTGLCSRNQTALRCHSLSASSKIDCVFDTEDVATVQRDLFSMGDLRFRSRMMVTPALSMGSPKSV